MEQVVLMYPESISLERISFLVNVKNIDQAIAEINLEMIKMKMQEAEEGESWTSEQCDSAEIEYKRYLQLCKIFGKGIVPNKIMDTVWHYHILDTRAYAQDCENVFGKMLHHFPYFGMGGEQDAINLKNSFLKTKEQYWLTFGEDMARDSHEMNCWHNCQSRCHNACKSK